MQRKLLGDGLGIAQRGVRQSARSLRHLASATAVFLTLGLAVAQPACAGAVKFNSTAEIDAHPNAVFGFGGVLTKGGLGDTILFQAGYGSDWILGGGYQRFVLSNRWGFSLGGEMGVAGRFDGSTTGEIWAAGVIRHAGFTLFDRLSIAGSVSFGFSAVSGPNSIERQREIAHNGNASFLFYLRPEIDVSTPRLPGTELFIATQHRSGGNGVLGNLAEGSNASVIGIRRRF